MLLSPSPAPPTTTLPAPPGMRSPPCRRPSRSLTWDQAIGPIKHRILSIDTGLPGFSCNPYNPCQRGTNENAVEPLRQYFPKGTDLSIHSNVEEEQAVTVF